MPQREKFFDADILVVDAQAALLEAAVAHLEPVFGAVATFFDSAKAAHHLQSGEHYKSILLDVTMQPVSGLALLQLARQYDAAAQVIMMSADALTDAVIQALQLGAVDYIVKPIADWDAVVRAVGRAVDTWNARRDSAALLRTVQARSEEQERTVALLRQLNQVTEQLHTVRDVREILNLMLRSISDSLQAQRISIMIRDPKNDAMSIHVAEGLDVASLKNVRVRPGDGVAGMVLASGRPLVVQDATQDPRVPKRPRGTPYQGRALMSIPLIIATREGGERVMGVVNVTDRLPDRPFTAAEVEFVTQMARQAALALTGAVVWQRIAHLAT